MKSTIYIQFIRYRDAAALLITFAALSANALALQDVFYNARIILKSFYIIYMYRNNL